MLDAFMFDRDWDEVRTRLARLAAISREQVVETARRWLGDELVIARRREGEPPVSRIPSFGLRELTLDNDSRSVLFDEVRAMPATVLELQVLREGVDYECTRTRAGLLVPHANPNNDLVQLTMRVHVGSVAPSGAGQGARPVVARGRRRAGSRGLSSRAVSLGRGRLDRPAASRPT